MKFKKYFYIGLVVFVCFLFTSCASENKNSNISQKPSKDPYVKATTYPLTIKDSYNREVTIEKEPLKVISGAPNITEIIFSLKKQKNLIGRTSYCDYPQDASNVASIGNIMEPNLEKMVEMNPDLIIASSIFKEEVTNKLDELGVKIIFIKDEKDFDGVYKSISKVGLILNANDEAQKIVLDMKKKVTEIKKKVQNSSKKNVYYIIGYGKYGDFTAGKDTFISQMIEMAGGRNIADDVTGWQYSLEKIVEKKPEILICSNHGGAKSEITVTNGYKDLEAVKKGNLFEIDNNLLERQGPRLTDGLLELAKIIHPESF